MDVTIKTYEESFLADQFNIGSALYDKWRMGGQTRIPQLKQAYSDSNFDPSTRFYAFIGDEMIGFLTAAAIAEKPGQAFFEFPYHKLGYEGVDQTLIDTAIETLRQKGFTNLIARAGPYWGRTRELAEKNGFVYHSNIVQATDIHLDEFNEKKIPSNIEPVDYNGELHNKAMVNLLVEKYGITKEQALANIKRFRDMKVGESSKNPWDQILTMVSNKVIMGDNKIMGSALALNVEAFGSKSVNLLALSAEDNRMESANALLASVIADCRAQEYHRLIIHIGPWGIPNLDDFFQSLNLEFTTKLAYYHKNL